nr:hypothetical protein Iba_chr08eCG6870 [Ipomoea batatas]
MPSAFDHDFARFSTLVKHLKVLIPECVGAHNGYQGGNDLPFPGHKSSGPDNYCRSQRFRRAISTNRDWSAERSAVLPVTALQEPQIQESSFGPESVQWRQLSSKLHAWLRSALSAKDLLSLTILMGV